MIDFTASDAVIVGMLAVGVALGIILGRIACFTFSTLYNFLTKGWNL